MVLKTQLPAGTQNLNPHGLQYQTSHPLVLTPKFKEGTEGILFTSTILLLFHSGVRTKPVSFVRHPPNHRTANGARGQSGASVLEHAGPASRHSRASATTQNPTTMATTVLVIEAGKHSSIDSDFGFTVFKRLHFRVFVPLYS